MRFSVRALLAGAHRCEVFFRRNSISARLFDVIDNDDFCVLHCLRNRQTQPVV
jgi:hypothetical protein